MTTSDADSDTAQKEQLLEGAREGQPLVPYKWLWGVLFFGWVVSYSDRTLTGPVSARSVGLTIGIVLTSSRSPSGSSEAGSAGHCA